MALTLLVASPGGHLDELYDLSPVLLGDGGERLWVTAATPQTTCLLAREPTEWVGPIASRQGGRALRRLPQAMALLRRYRPDRVVSTGAAMAAPYLVAARLLGVETHYIESATRLDGPSMTGRLMARVPGTHLHHQSFMHPVRRWHRVGSVFDAYAPGPSADRPIRRVTVILGTERYPFPRAIELVQRTFGADVEVTVQTGHTPAPRTDSRFRPWVPYDELVDIQARADLVITHAGVGSVLSAMRLGKHPLVLPRVSRLGEHVDDHQSQLAGMLCQRGLATVLTRDGEPGPLLRQAAARSTVRVGSPLRPAAVSGPVPHRG